MDESTRRRRHNEAPAPISHTTSTSRYPMQQDPSQQRRSMAGGTSERYRPAPLNTSPQQPRGLPGSTSYSTYGYQEPVGAFAGQMTQTALPAYAADYSQDGRTSQNFNAYNPAMMGYHIGTGAQNNVYENQAFNQRQQTAAQIIPAEVTTGYFSADPAAAQTAPTLQHATSSSATASAYPPPQVPNYSTSMSSAGGITQQASSSADVSMEEQEYPAGGGLEEKWMEYQAALRGVFQNIRSGILESASQSLLDVSNWLLSQVADLGLNLDDQNLHSDRIKLWNDFNHAWLGLFQRQKDLMESGQLQRSQTIITRDGIEKMGKELIRLCDGIERHGLVDYHYGVWEELIIAVITDCLDLYEAAEEGDDDSRAGASGGSARRQHEGSGSARPGGR